MGIHRVLVIGGAGFVGSHVVDELLCHGYQVRVLDASLPKAHQAKPYTSPSPPPYLSTAVEFAHGDVRDLTTLRISLSGVASVIHVALPAKSERKNNELSHYTCVDDLGTDVLADALADHPIKKLVVASSMCIYGEGLYQDRYNNAISVGQRSRQQLAQHKWDLMDDEEQPLQPIPTRETKSPELYSAAALCQFIQERQYLMWGETYHVPTIALRLFNVYGSRQFLTDGNVGVIASIAAQYLRKQSPVIFEDGLQLRDFVHVRDIARGVRLALESELPGSQVYNLGSGKGTTILEVARKLSQTLNCDFLQPETVGQYRDGDIRHCFADITKARTCLGYEPETTLSDGLTELARWLENEPILRHLPTIRMPNQSLASKSQNAFT